MRWTPSSLVSECEWQLAVLDVKINFQTFLLPWIILPLLVPINETTKCIPQEDRTLRIHNCNNLRLCSEETPSFLALLYTIPLDRSGDTGSQN